MVYLLVAIRYGYLSPEVVQHLDSYACAPVEAFPHMYPKSCDVLMSQDSQIFNVLFCAKNQYFKACVLMRFFKRSN